MNKKRTTTRGDKREARQEMHLTRPPRMEGKVKEAMMQPIKKKKRVIAKKSLPRKKQGYSERQRQEYQLKSRRH